MGTKERANRAIVDKVFEIERMENEVENIPMIFAEMFKDEINAVDETRIYNGLKRLIKKYADDTKAISAIEEMARVICGGTALEEILQITMDEAVNPSAASALSLNSRQAEIDVGD